MPKPEPILWIGNDFPTEDVCLNNQKVEIKKLNWNGSFADVLAKPYSLIVGEVSEKGHLDILENLRLSEPHTWVGVYLKNAPKETVRKALNSNQIKFAVDHKQKISDELEYVLKDREVRHRQDRLLRDYYQKNKSLESLTSDLEKIVVERTLHLEQSNKDQSDKISTERALIRFIKEIASFAAVEDILAFLRKEFKKFHSVGEPLLCLQYGKVSQIYYFRTGNIQKLTAANSFKFFDLKEFDGKSASMELANLLARPIAKGTFFSLSLNLLSELYQSPSKALLFFEHSSADTPDFEEFVQERINPISISLDRVLLEQELDVFSYRWEKTFDGIKDPVAIIDTDFNVLRCNKKFAAVVPDRTILKTLPSSGEVRLGSGVYEVRSYPIRMHPQEKPTSFVHQYIDVTETRELYVRLLQQEKMGALGTLAGHIAHELNNPLTGIRSLSQVLGAEVEDSQLKSDLHEIESSAGRCQRIIKNLLEFSQDQEGELESVSLDEVVERTLPMLKTALRTHRLEMDLQTKNKKIPLYSHLLQQVVFNLVNNACQAMATSGKVGIATREKSGELFLEISDTGHGIPDEIRDRIFEPFFTTKPVSQGTGLGLSIAKTVVERCGGQISFESKKNQGTKFILKFLSQGAAK